MVFEQSWQVVKMPIVPGSVYRDYRREREREERMKLLSDIDPGLATAPRGKLYSAKFDDPETGEQLDMRGRYDRPDRTDMLSVYIKEPDSLAGENLDPLEYPLIRPGERAYADFSSIGLRRMNPDYWYSVGTKTKDDFQRRGYATALYDLAAYILDRQKREGGAPLKPSYEQTSAAKALWTSRLGDMEFAQMVDRENWPVRGDLG